MDMVHKKFPDVNPEIFLWRDKHKVLHSSKTSHAGDFTRCGLYTDDLSYAGRLEAPTCLACVTTTP